mgnify:CR=1 FL=1
MKKSAAASLLVSTFLLGGLMLGEDSSAAPSAQGFVCGTSAGVPSFGAAGWTPERRCQDVSTRFDQYLKEGRLKYLTTGRMNGAPVICTSLTDGGPCDRLLYTLNPGQNRTASLESLLEVKKQKMGPSSETISRVYISIDQIMNKEWLSEVDDSKVKRPSSAPEDPVF